MLSQDAAGSAARLKKMCHAVPKWSPRMEHTHRNCWGEIRCCRVSLHGVEQDLLQSCGKAAEEIGFSRRGTTTLTGWKVWLRLSRNGQRASEKRWELCPSSSTESQNSSLLLRPWPIPGRASHPTFDNQQSAPFFTLFICKAASNAVLREYCTYGITNIG
jgi:hypothetical protein